MNYFDFYKKKTDKKNNSFNNQIKSRMLAHPILARTVLYVNSPAQAALTRVTARPATQELTVKHVILKYPYQKNERRF